MPKDMKAAMLAGMRLLEAYGYSRKRSDLALREDGEVWQGVAIQKRSISGGLAEFFLFAVAIWPEFQILCDKGWGVRHSKYRSYSMTKPINTAEPIFFQTGNGDEGWQDVFEKIIAKNLPSKLQSMSTREDIENYWNGQLNGSFDVAQRVVAIDYILRGREYALKRMGQFLKSDSFNDEDKDRISTFWSNIEVFKPY